MSASVSIGLFFLLAFVGCADDGATPDGGPDGSVDGGDGGIELLVTPPAIPWLEESVPPIMLTPCPEGWREVHGGAVIECAPYPEGGAEPCDAGEAHFPGEPRCRSIGEACPSGDYAMSVPSSGVVIYVNAAASAGGDGTLAAPFAGLSEVPWPTLGAGTTVALGRGSYPGTMPLKAGVRVLGACVRDTVLTGETTPVHSVVVVTSAGDSATVTNLTIRGAPQRGATVERGHALRVQGVLLDRVQGFGVLAEGAGSEVTLTDVVIRETQNAIFDAGESGVGLEVQAGAHLDARRLIVAGNRLFGVSGTGAGAVVTLADTVIRDTRERVSDDVAGRGINVQGGARLDAVRLLVAENRDIGVFTSGAGSTVTLTDALIRGTESRATDGGRGRGINVQSGAEVSCARAVIAENRDAAIYVDEAGSTVRVTDVVIRDTEPAANGSRGGRGVGVQAGAHFEATRLLVSGNTELGCFVTDEGSSVSLTDTVVEGTRSIPLVGGAGRGVEAQAGARLEVARLLIADNHDVGLLATGLGTLADLSDAVVRGTRAHPSSRRFGRGIEAQRGARIDGARLEIVHNMEIGVDAAAGGVLVLSDISIRGVEIAECGSSSCLDKQYGYGVGAYSATLSLTRFVVEDAAICGVMIAREQGPGQEPSLDLEAGMVTGAAIGSCIQVDGYDLDRLTSDVRYYDNGTNLDATMLPVPDLATPL